MQSTASVIMQVFDFYKNKKPEAFEQPRACVKQKA